MKLDRTFFLLSFLTTVLFPFSALAEDAAAPTMANVLGVRSAAVANAIETGAKRDLGKDELSQRMDKEESKFLSRGLGRSPVVYDAQEAAKYQQPGDRAAGGRLNRRVEARQAQLKQRQEEALEMLEFRQNVEDAMGKILSFQPTLERVEEAQWAPQPGPVPTPEDGWDYPSGRDSADPRDRLMATVEGRDMTYSGRRPMPQQRALAAPEYREPALQQTLLFNRTARGTQPQPSHSGNRRIRVINDDSRGVRKTAGGVVRLRR